ncbi:MAG: hypothetical protein PHI47_04635 [Sulfuricurvum sp.]|uniref:hypothetical protein n=1 Tax=Sulfuricurvum sp. TaxID=2025608 RepID=UPI00261D10EF|nr:hypothetical protein [Sulfuricurvum sp.]MDD5159314.1 hypothetical protein [Sulfuricurvum sp.]
MIDNFDQLVMRCEKARQRRILRLSFMIVGTLLFVIAGIAGFQMWINSASTPAVLEKIPEVAAQAPAPAASEINRKITPSAATPVTAPKTTPTKVSPDPSVITPGVKPSVLAPETPPSTVDKVPTITTVAVQAPKSNRLFEVNTQNASTPVDAYQNNPKYETALAAARDFYAKENFIEAAIWAKKANQLNREAEEAWLLYAKSYYAQGRKSEAIGVLELYLNYKDSKAASELLRTWKLNSTN